MKHVAIPAAPAYTHIHTHTLSLLCSTLTHAVSRSISGGGSDLVSAASLASTSVIRWFTASSVGNYTRRTFLRDYFSLESSFGERKWLHLLARLKTKAKSSRADEEADSLFILATAHLSGLGGKKGRSSRDEERVLLLPLCSRPPGGACWVCGKENREERSENLWKSGSHPGEKQTFSSYLTFPPKT